MFLLVASFSVFVDGNAFTLCTVFALWFGVVAYVFVLVCLDSCADIVNWFID